MIRNALFISDKKCCCDCIEFISQTGALAAGTNKTGRQGWQGGSIYGPSLAANILAAAMNRTMKTKQGRLAGPTLIGVYQMPDSVTRWQHGA